MNGLADSELADVEEHLLVCESCQGRLAHEDSFRQGMRDGGAFLFEQARQPVLRRVPKLAWAFGFAAMILAVFAAGQWRLRPPGPPAVILLQATRGGEPAQTTAVAGKPLTVALDLTGLPQSPEYTLEVVDTSGRPAHRAKGISRGNRLQATFESGLAAGTYFVRIYAPGGELLREYVLPVRG